MSNRSAKLLLEVARHVELHGERHRHGKLCSNHDIPLDVGLVQEIETWAKGYRDHLKRMGASDGSNTTDV